MKILLDHSTTKNYNMSIKLYANSNILVFGSSESGKTTAVLKIIEEKLIEPMPKKIFYSLWSSSTLYGLHDKYRVCKRFELECNKQLQRTQVVDY